MKDFLVILAVNDAFSCAFLGSLCDAEESARESCTFMCVYVVDVHVVSARSALLQLVSQIFQTIMVRIGARN